MSQYPNCLVRMVVVNSQEELLSVQNELEDKNRYLAFEDFEGKGYLAAPIYHAYDYKNHEARIFDAITKKKAIECVSSLSQLSYLFQYIIIAIDDVHIDDCLTGAMVKVVSDQEAENQCCEAKLYRVASNINLVYTLQYNQRASVKDVNEKFRKMCDMEFEDLKDSYNADSSYASGCARLVEKMNIEL